MGSKISNYFWHNLLTNPFQNPDPVVQIQKQQGLKFKISYTNLSQHTPTNNKHQI